MPDTNRKADKPMLRLLTPKQFHLVNTLDHMGDQAYLNAIFREVNKPPRTALVDLGAIHIVLNRLRKVGVLETYNVETNDFADGRTRTLVVYKLSKAGRKIFDASRASFAALAKS